MSYTKSSIDEIMYIYFPLLGIWTLLQTVPLSFRELEIYILYRVNKLRKWVMIQ